MTVQSIAPLGWRRYHPAPWRTYILLVTLAFLSACTVGPDYVRPEAVVPPDYKELEGWKTAEPNDGVIRGAWWEIFDDPELNALEEQVYISNENVIAAEAQFRAAVAIVEATRAGYYPTVTIGLSATRQRFSDNVATGLDIVSPTTGGTTPTTVSHKAFTTYAMPIDASWEADVWGRIRRSVEASAASAQASAADLQTGLLSAQAALAQDFYLIRTLDAQRQLLDETAVAYQKSLDLTHNRYEGGIASRADVVQAITQLQTTQAQAIEIGVQRAQVEHAIAVLIGTPPSAFSIPVKPLDTVPPEIPAGVPSELLERRPDIATAERLVASANAQIGVAEAAYFPTVTLSAETGFEGSKLSNWFVWPSRFFSVGPAISETVYDGGFRAAQTDQARATYDANVAIYRQIVLAGFQEVEDNLAALRILAHEAEVQAEAVKAARESVELTTNQYKAGIRSYIDVVTVQTTALSNEVTAVNLLGRRMNASVLLVKALGGGWNAAELPEI